MMLAVHLPEDLVSLFAVVARDVIWYKRNLLRFFRSEGVPKAILIEIERRKEQPTIKLCQYVVDVLKGQGTEGITVIQRLMTAVADWKDLSHLEPEKRSMALRRRTEFKKAIHDYADQQRYRLQKEKEAQQQRIERVQIRELDHTKLQQFRERFDTIFVMADPKARGDAFEALLNDIFTYYCQKSLGPFSRMGEQIDGQFYFDGHYYFVEARWREEKATAADVSVLRDRASAGFGGDVRALFISFNGYTQECLGSLQKRASTERVILMDGSDLRTVLNGDIAFDVLLDEKLARAVRDGRPLVSAREIILEQIEKG